jgi:hypothetical protein
MIKYALAAALAAGLPFAAVAQDTAPDSGSARTFEPYVGVLGGYDTFDDSSDFSIPGRTGKMNSALIEGVAGVNVPLGSMFFVGAEGNIAKGIGDIDWEYGAKARAGIRAGQSSLLYLTAGYQWVDGRRGYDKHNDWVYGGGVELSPKDLGFGGEGTGGPRLRLQVDTYDFQNIRPMAGVVFGF